MNLYLLTIINPKARQDLSVYEDLKKYLENGLTIKAVNKQEARQLAHTNHPIIAEISTNIPPSYIVPEPPLKNHYLNLWLDSKYTDIKKL